MEKSAVYEKFLKEQEVHLGFYETAAKWAYNFVGLNVENERVNQEMKDAEFVIRYKDSFCLAIIMGLLTLPFSAFIYLFGNSNMANYLAFVLPFLIFGAFTYIPSYLAKIRKLKIIGQAPLAILYLVIAMEVTPNLETSVAFAARNMPNPMGIVFKHLLWLVETRKIPNMEQAFSWYSQQIKDWAPSLAEGMYLISGSMRESGAMKRRSLEKAIAVVLEGTKGTMEGFVRSLDLPVMATNAFGIMLPVLMLIMGPIASVFSTSNNMGNMLLIIYDFLIPLILITISFYILGKRPGGISEIQYKKPKFKVKVMGMNLNAKPLMIMSFVFLSALQVLLLMVEPNALSPVAIGGRAISVAVTVPGILALGLPLGIYLLSWAQENQDIKKRVQVLETEFASALYQLGNIMNEGVPIEEAMRDVATRMKGSETEAFFVTTVNRLRTLGWPIERSLFDEKYGTLLEFPSNLVRNIMQVLIKSADKGPRSAALTAISVSKYLQAMQNVKNKITDLLSESISGLRFQGMILIPILTGTIVGLGQITSDLLMTIAQQISGTIGGGMSMGYGYIGDFINVDGIIQPSFLQAVVGIYVILTILIIGFLVGGLEEGWEKMTMFLNMGKLVTYGAIIYALTSTLISVLFGGIAGALM